MTGAAAKELAGPVGAASGSSRDAKIHICVYGKYGDPLFQKYRVAAEHLSKDWPNITATIEGFFETQYEQQLRYTVGKYGGSFNQCKPSTALVYAETDDSVLFFLNEERFMQWALKRFRYEDQTRLIFYKKLANKAHKSIKEQRGRSYCGLGISIAGEPKDIVQIELFDEECPEMAKNFLDLLTLANFNGHPVHRVKAGAWVQAGDLVDGSGKHTVAANGNFLRHESFQVKHDRPGLLGMANHGKDTNGSQFYITLRELPFLDGKSVIIGRVISGMRVLLKINKLATRNERPIKDVRIYADPEYTVVGALQLQRPAAA